MEERSTNTTAILEGEIKLVVVIEVTVSGIDGMKSLRSSCSS